jgi:DNA polymerase-3 subunit epsilon
MRMLNKVWLLLGYEPVTITTIDTMLLQIYVVEKAKGYVPKGGALGNSIAFYDLSTAPEHNALDDALATLTLLYAQLHQLDKSGGMSLKRFSHTGAIKTFRLG